MVGAGNSYGVGDTGGSSSVTLTVDQMPSHSHNISTVSGNWNNANPFKIVGGRNPSYSSANSNSTGGGQSHENRPPYYALCYIMKS